MAAKMSQAPMKFSAPILKVIQMRQASAMVGANRHIVAKSRLPKSKYMPPMARHNPKSPTLLKMRALIADLTA